MTAFGPHGTLRQLAEPTVAAPLPEQSAPKTAPARTAEPSSPAPPAPTPPTVSTDAGSGPDVAPAPENSQPEVRTAVPADIEHLKRAWPVVLDAVKRRQAGLFAVLSEGRPDSLDGNDLVVRFPAGYGFQANQVSRGENPRVISEALKEITGRDLRVIPQVTAEPAAQPVAEEEGARILSKDELIRVLKQEFDAQIIDDGPAR